MRSTSSALNLLSTGKGALGWAGLGWGRWERWERWGRWGRWGRWERWAGRGGGSVSWPCRLVGVLRRNRAAVHPHPVHPLPRRQRWVNPAAVGSYVAAALVAIVGAITGGSWIAANTNQASLHAVVAAGGASAFNAIRLPRPTPTGVFFPSFLLSLKSARVGRVAAVGRVRRRLVGGVAGGVLNCRRGGGRCRTSALQGTPWLTTPFPPLSEQAHYDYFFLTLMGLMLLTLVAFVYIARRFSYRKVCGVFDGALHAVVARAGLVCRG